MLLTPLTSLDDARLDDYARLTDVALRRRREPAGGLYIAESTKVIARALQAGHTPRSVLTQERWLADLEPMLRAYPDLPVFTGGEALLQELTGYRLHRGALAAMHRPALPAVEEVLSGARRVAVLEDLVDHTNVGAVFRSAAAIGVDAVLVTPRCADPLYRRSIRVSMGTVFHIPWTRIDPWPESVQRLKDAGYFMAGMSLADGAITLDELAAQGLTRLALVFGTEGEGLSAGCDRALDARVTIPMMHGVDSLNVAAASAVAFYATR